jgi:hypothetical protein
MGDELIPRLVGRQWCQEFAQWEWTWIRERRVAGKRPAGVLGPDAMAQCDKVRRQTTPARMTSSGSHIPGAYGVRAAPEHERKIAKSTGRVVGNGVMNQISAHRKDLFVA